jgi:hypothetical protein
MGSIPLTILGAGSVQYGPAVIGSLASYYGERPLDVRLFDADEERLDLFDRLARLVFEGTSVDHGVKALEDPTEALVESQLVVLAVDENCARKLLRREKAEVPFEADAAIQAAVDRLVPLIPEDALVLSLMPRMVTVGRDTYYRMAWPPSVDEEGMLAIPMQVLRWLNDEEMFYPLLESHERSPFKQWLDDPSSAEPVIGR